MVTYILLMKLTDKGIADVKTLAEAHRPKP